MTIILLAVTLASVAVSCALLAVVVRLTREERLRSEARSAALAEALGVPAFVGRPVTASTAGATPEQRVPVTADDRLSLVAVEPIALADAFRTELNDPPSGAAAATMFGSHAVEGRPAWHALMIPLVGVLVVSLAGAMIVAARHRQSSPSATSSGATAPLELVTLGAQRNGAALTISGVVRNSRDGQSQKDMSASISLFDRQGALVSTSVVALDYPRLQPGDESPFSLTAAQAAGVARYRVSFRSGSMTLPHIDRRGTPAATVQSMSAR